MKKLRVDEDRLIMTAANSGFDLPADDLFLAARRVRRLARRWGRLGQTFAAASAATLLSGLYLTAVVGVPVLYAVEFAPVASACVGIMILCYSKKHGMKDKEYKWTSAALASGLNLPPTLI